MPGKKDDIATNTQAPANTTQPTQPAQTTVGGGGIGIPDLFPGGIGSFLHSVGNMFTQQAAADRSLAEKTLAEQKLITESATQYQQIANKTADEYAKIRAQGEEARRLADGDIFDRITLVGEQILNPQKFTREGRDARMSDLSMELGAAGQIHNVQIAASSARIEQARAQNLLDTVGLDSGMKALRLQVETMNLATQGIAAAEAMRAANLTKIELPDLQKALTLPPQKNGKISLGGIEYSPTEIRERAKNLEVREKLSFMSPAVTDPDYMQKLAVSHELQLSTMSPAELQTIRSNGFIMPNGEQVMPAVWEAANDRQNRLMVEDITRKQNEHMIQNQVPAMMEQGMKLIDSTTKYTQPGTPFALEQTAYKAALGAAAELTNTPEGQTPAGKIAQLEILQKAQERYVSAIQTEATRRAAGDKELAMLYTKQMTGQIISADEVGDVMRTRYISRKGLSTDLIGNEASQRIRINADKILSKLQIQKAASGGFGVADLSEKEMREQAFNEAFMQEQGTMGVTGVNQISQYLTKRKDNPAAKAGMFPAKIQQLQGDANIAALNKAQTEFGLTDEQMRFLQNGDAESAKLDPNKASQIMDSINQMTVAFEYDLLERERPGLGYEMKEWYSQVMPEVVDQYLGSLSPMQAAMASDAVRNEADKYVFKYRFADESASRRSEAAVTELMTGAKKPENAWIVMLNMNKNLADSEKQSIYYDVVLPTIQQSRNMKLSDEDTSKAVFQAINTFETNDPTLKSALRSVQRGLPDVIDNFEKNWQITIASGLKTGRDVYFLIAADNFPNAANTRLKSVVPWLK